MRTKLNAQRLEETKQQLQRIDEKISQIEKDEFKNDWIEYSGVVLMVMLMGGVVVGAVYLLIQTLGWLIICWVLLFLMIVVGIGRFFAVRARRKRKAEELGRRL